MFKIKINSSKLLKILILILIFVITVIIFCHKINFLSLDLGRHLENGKIIFSDASVLYNNFYSFTEPNFNFINHHWLSGVIFYFIYSLGGFFSLSIFNLIFILLTIFILFFNIKKRTNFWLASLFILPAILLLSQRTDIRPETLSGFFLILVYCILDNFRKNKNKKILFLLIPIQLIWVNLHIYFFMGLFLISLFLLKKIIFNLKNFFNSKENKFFLLITFFCYLVSFINPNFFKGFIYPFLILKKYGYEIVENKSPFYLENLTINYNIDLFKMMVFVLFISFLFSFLKRRKIRFFEFCLALFFTSISFFAIRNITFFALMTFPVIAINFYDFKEFFKNNKRTKIIFIFTIFLIYSLVLIFLLKDINGEKKYLKYDFGFGLENGVEDSIKFYRENSLHGPIFNNYDNGSALIFWLYPEEKVFVDNRPEAYSVDFFNNIYKPMQNNDEEWKKYSEEYKINIIYFSHTDGTPWSRTFLRNRLQDEQWVLVYFDYYSVIMVKNNPENIDLINRMKIDENNFKEKFNDIRLKANYNQLINLANFSELFNYDEFALNIYEDILKKQFNNGRILVSYGYLLSKSDLVKSIYYFQKAIDAGYKLPSIYNQIALNYWYLGDYFEAKKMWNKSLEINKKDEHANYYLKQVNELIK